MPLREEPLSVTNFELSGLRVFLAQNNIATGLTENESNSFLGAALKDEVRERIAEMMEAVDMVPATVSEGDEAVSVVDERKEAISRLCSILKRHIAIFRGSEAYLKDISDKRLKGHPLLPTQRFAALAFFEWIKRGLFDSNLMGHIVKPTGIGKGLTAMMLSEMAGGKLIFIADNNSNGGNAVEEFTEHQAGLAQEKQRSVGRSFGGLHETDRDIVVTNFASARTWEGIQWSEVHLIVIDEGDVNALSFKRSAFITELAKVHGIPVVAMSATEHQALNIQ